MAVGVFKFEWQQLIKLVRNKNFKNGRSLQRPRNRRFLCAQTDQPRSIRVNLLFYCINANYWFCNHCHTFCRKVFLGYKKQNPENIYAIKVLNKLDIVHRNMASQGKIYKFIFIFKKKNYKNISDVVIRERNALAISKSPFCVQLFYCLQNSSNIYMVSIQSYITFNSNEIN